MFEYSTEKETPSSYNPLPSMKTTTAFQVLDTVSEYTTKGTREGACREEQRDTLRLQLTRIP